MSLEVIPLKAGYCPDMCVYGEKPREFVIEDLVRMILDSARRHIKIADERGPYGQPIITASLDILDGMGNLRDIERSILDRARMQADVELSMERAALARAKAEFAERFRAAVTEFWGYDECAGRC